MKRERRREVRMKENEEEKKWIEERGREGEETREEEGEKDREQQ